MSLLERIHSPADLRSLTRPELEALAAEIVPLVSSPLPLSARYRKLGKNSSQKAL